MDWAQVAYDNLLRSLSPQRRAKLPDYAPGNESYVVVFGQTQVGKTTLLLELMEVAPAHLHTVSEVLRGGRATGESSTATAMEYGRSPDGRWGLEVEGPTQWWPDEAGITAALATLRSTMEAGELGVTTPCVVHIPAHYFMPAEQGSTGLRILDLPGVNARNADEQAHVAEMAATYIPLADLIVLVGKGDKLDFLRPGRIVMPGIANWQKMAYRFRVVTTFATSDDRVQELIRNTPNLAAHHLRTRLIGQIASFGGLSPAAQNPDWYFPLEIGKSWASMAEHQPAMHARLQPIMAQLRAELHAQLRTSTSPLGRLRNMHRTHLSIEAMAEAEREDLQSQLNSQQERCKESRLQRIQLRRLGRRVARQCAQIQILHDGRVKEAVTLALQPTYTSGSPWPWMHDYAGHKTCTALRSYQLVWEQALRHMTLEPRAALEHTYLKRLRAALQPPTQAQLQAAIDKAFTDINSILAGYTLDTYWRSGNYQRDLLHLQESGQQAFYACEVLWHAAWAQALRSVNADIAQTLRRLQAEQLQTSQVVASITQALVPMKQACASLVLQLWVLEAQTAQDVARCQAFVQLLNEAYGQKFLQQWEHAWTCEEPADLLLHVLSCEAVRQQHADFTRPDQLQMDNNTP